MKVWLKLNLRKIVCGNGWFIRLYRKVTLKMMSRSPKSNQLFPPFQQCFNASLIKISLLAQNKAQGDPILNITEYRCVLENWPRSPKSDQLFPSSQQWVFASLVNIHQLVQKIMQGNESGCDTKADADADGIHTKNNISPTLWVRKM